MAERKVRYMLEDGAPFSIHADGLLIQAVTRKSEVPVTLEIEGVSRKMLLQFQAAIGGGVAARGGGGRGGGGRGGGKAGGQGGAEAHGRGGEGEGRAGRRAGGRRPGRRRQRQPAGGVTAD